MRSYITKIYPIQNEIVDIYRHHLQFKSIQIYFPFEKRCQIIHGLNPQLRHITKDRSTAFETALYALVVGYERTGKEVAS